jgi:hypothetical protein
VAVDADSFFFLHDLITSYLKEKDKVVPPTQTNRSASPNLSVNSNSQISSSNMEGLSSNISASTLSMASDTSSANVVGPSTIGSNKNLNNLSGHSSTVNVNSSEDLRHVVGNKKISASTKLEKVDLESIVQMDWRTFNCKTWHLEPTIR